MVTRVVVTGLSGNLGTALLRRWAPRVAAGTLELVGVCRRPPAGGEPYHLPEWVCLDLADARATRRLTEVVDGADAVVHLAWDFQPSRDTAYLERVAVGGTRAVRDAVVAAGVPHLVHTSSLGVYSPGPRPRPGVPVDGVTESWPRRGIGSLAYSRHKVAAEDLLDDVQRSVAAPAIARLRPALVLQHDAASALGRYGLPSLVPVQASRWLRVLPLDRTFVVQVVHADDVAAAIDAAVERRATGAFNLAAEPVLDRDALAAAFGAVGVHVPGAVLRAGVAASWRARLQPLDPGWLDLAFAVPVMDSGRARAELGWQPERDAHAVITDLVAGLHAAAGTSSPALRRRSVVADTARSVLRGPIGQRRLP